MACLLVPHDWEIHNHELVDTVDFFSTFFSGHKSERQLFILRVNKGERCTESSE